MSTTYHSAFTPSLSDSATLERLFVAREDIAQTLEESIRTSAETGNKLQQLLIGPRGIGKTHLVAVVHHRVRSDAALDAALRIAWLSEDPYVADYRDLLLDIAHRLKTTYGLTELGPELDKVLDHGRRDGAVERLEALILRCVATRTLLLIVENIDDLLQAIGDSGQRQLRAFIQNCARITLLATTTSLVDELTQRDRIFFGFFRMIELYPLTVTEAAEQLKRLALSRGNTDLANALDSPMGRARVRAVHYLANGNPRVYAVLFDFLSRELLDDLVRPFMKLIDELTPYYQARMSRLAPLQRRIVDVMRRMRGAGAVKDIARLALSTSQTVSSQLGKLHNLGYVVQADSLGRSNYYELREPLMRLCLEVKESRGRSVELFIEFLRIWHSERELQILSDRASAPIEREHFTAAFERVQSEGDPVIKELMADIDTQITCQRYGPAMEAVTTALQRAPGLVELLQWRARIVTMHFHSVNDLVAAWTRMTEADKTDADAWEHLTRSAWESTDTLTTALKASEHLLSLRPDSTDALRLRADTLDLAGHVDESRVLRARVVRNTAEPTTAKEWAQRCIDHYAAGQNELSLDAALEVLRLEPQQETGWREALGLLMYEGHYRLYYNVAERLAGAWPESLNAQLMVVWGLLSRGRTAAALTQLDLAQQAQEHVSKELIPLAAVLRALMLAEQGQHLAARSALEEFEALAPVQEYNLWQTTEELRAAVLIQMDSWEQGLVALQAMIDRPHFASEGVGYSVIASLMRSTRNPGVWQRHIMALIDVFVRNNQLHVLGNALVLRIRGLFTLDGLSASDARAWHGCWSQAGAQHESLQLPLSLLEAAVRMKAGDGSIALLNLPLEQRSLLAHWLHNLLLEEPDARERQLAARFDEILYELSLQREAAAKQRWWTMAREQQPSAAIDFPALLTAYRDSPVLPDRRVPPLLPGPWQALPHDAALSALQRLAATDPLAARALSRPRLRVLGVQQRTLAFTDWQLLDIAIEDDGRGGVLDALLGDDEGRVIDGTSATFFSLQESGVAKLSTVTAKRDYTRLFVSQLRAETRFAIVDSVEHVRREFGDSPALSDVVIRPWRAERAPPGGEPRYVAAMLYKDHLYEATLVLWRKKPRVVEMIEDRPLAGPLALPGEVFDGPLRLLPQPQS